VPQKSKSIIVLNSPVRMYLIQVIQRLELNIKMYPWIYAGFNAILNIY